MSLEDDARALVAESQIDGAAVLDEIHDFLGRFVAYPSEECRVAHTLWIAHTHLMDAWESTPRLAFLSPEPASGKSRALEVTELLVPRAVEAVNVTPAYLFRKVGSEEGRPTILYDEIDTVFGPKARDNEEIRGLINAGHRKGAVAGRCVTRGTLITTEEIPAYCALALAGLGDLPDTIFSRSVIIRMRRRAPGESVQPYRRRDAAIDGHRICERMALWAASVESYAGDLRPVMPSEIQDRDADVWEALIAIADAAGMQWPERARVSAVSLVSQSKEGSPSLGIQLLADLQKIFAGFDVMFSDQILSGLHAMDEAPWGDIRGKAIDARGLARILNPYGVKSKQVRIGNMSRKGYLRADLHDVWARYLEAPPQEDETNETNETSAPSVSVVSHVSGFQDKGPYYLAKWGEEE